MICRECGKNVATTHIKTIINGELAEYLLCPDCASKLGYNNIFSDWGLNFGTVLKSFSKKESGENELCSFCKTSFSDIIKSGKPGCPKCYEVFLDKLTPSIQKIHGHTSHTGKVPGSSALAIRKDFSIRKIDEMEIKKKQLQDAIKEQNFELAAKLRDEIKEMEESK